MEQNFFELLPSEIVTNILLRFNVRTVAISKCVCKSWLDFFESDEFAEFLSRSAAGLAVLVANSTSTRCGAFELEGADDLRYSYLTEFEIPRHVKFRGSANGMLLLQNYDINPHRLYVWSPISREYIELEFPSGFFAEGDDIDEAAYGIGVSEISGQHKVVCFEYTLNDCYVYTLGTGSWRRVEVPRLWTGHLYIDGVFVSGNLHWAACADRDADEDSIYRFDLETECFSTLATPPPVGDFHNLSVLRDCLCLTDRETSKGHLVVWLLKEYGDEKSWFKEYVIEYEFDWSQWRGLHVYPLKLLRNGDVLMVWYGRSLYYYSTKTKTLGFGDFNQFHHCARLMPFTPSFLSLKNFPMENVISLGLLHQEL